MTTKPNQSTPSAQKSGGVIRVKKKAKSFSVVPDSLLRNRVKIKYPI